MLVAWSAMRSRFLAIVIRSSAPGMVEGSFCITAISSLVITLRWLSTASSELRMDLAMSTSRFTKEFRLPSTIDSTSWGQIGKAVDNGEARLMHQSQRTFDNADGKVAHAFKICVDFDGDGDKAHIARYRLGKGDHAGREIIDLDFELIDAGFVSDHLMRQNFVGIDQGQGASMYGRSHKTAHFKQLLI